MKVQRSQPEQSKPPGEDARTSRGCRSVSRPRFDVLPLLLGVIRWCAEAGPARIPGLPRATNDKPFENG